MLLGIAVLVHGTDTGNESGNSEERSDGMLAAPPGFAVGGGGTWLLWISPDPEPASAWGAVATMGTADFAVGTRARKAGARNWGTALMATAAATALAFIVRASVKSFG